MVYKQYADNYPNIMKLKTKESEIKSKLNEYRSSQKDYISNLRTNSTENAKDNLAIMDSLNIQLVILFSEAKSLMKKVYPIGIDNQKIVSESKTNISALDNKLKKYNKKLTNIQNSLNNVEAKHESTHLEAKSNQIQYYWASINAAMATIWVFLFISFPDLSKQLIGVLIFFIVICIIYLIYKKQNK